MAERDNDFQKFKAIDEMAKQQLLKSLKSPF